MPDNTAPETPRRPGRPRGASDTRERILASARELFARDGLGGTPIRTIAAHAGVDSALVHHYFGTKEKLFAAAVDLPIDPSIVVAQLREVPVSELGHTLAMLILQLWESDVQPQLKATLRAALADNQLASFGVFLREVVFTQVATRIDTPAGSGLIRAEFAASQILGVLMARHIMDLQPFATLPIEQVIATVAPTLQRYLTGDLPNY